MCTSSLCWEFFTDTIQLLSADGGDPQLLVLIHEKRAGVCIDGIVFVLNVTDAFCFVFISVFSFRESALQLTMWPGYTEL